MPKNFLDKIYKSNFNISSNKLYKMWAPYYDKELTDNQYVTPFRCAQILNDLIYDKEVNLVSINKREMHPKNIFIKVNLSFIS